jgi:hypothetical protein
MSKELQIQKFLRSGKTLEDLYQRYEIQSTLSPNKDLAVFNYRILAPMDMEIVQESRALVLDTKNWDVISKAPNAFFAYEESFAKDTLAKFDWASAKAMTKLDGALVTLFYHQKEWHLCTRYSVFGENLIYTINASPSKLTWRELVELTLKNMGYSWEGFTKRLDKNICYTFEITSPENRVIVVYTTQALTLCAAINKQTLEELDIYSLTFPKLKVDYVLVSSLEDVFDLIKQNDDPLSYEGYIVIDKNFNRLKVRNPKFIQMMQFYSPKDEITALREIRMMDANSGYDTGTGSGGTGGTGTGPDLGTGEIFSTQNLVTRMLILSKYVNDTFDKIKNNEVNMASHQINDIWPEAIEYKKRGMSMSDILDKSSEDEILTALFKFEEVIKRNSN